MPLALWGVVGLLVLILANGMAWLGLVPVLPTFSSYSLFDGIYYSDNRSNSRANTCNKPRLLEGMHLLDKRSTQALPVALMIHDNSSDRTAFVPATHHSNFCPINFRCWTLGWVDRSASGVHRLARPFCRRCAPGLNWPGRASGAVTLKKLECSGPHARYTDVFNESIALADRPGKRESSARVDYVPALCTHRPSLLPIEWSGEVFGLRRRGRFAARDVEIETVKGDSWGPGDGVLRVLSRHMMQNDSRQRISRLLHR
ncbi:hypothetical protein VNO78_34661 [Psophocarpus tetragonolobus]|uniref:Uncharacterized protein n=1 Tax=Psophocarpus tetragonolobus TaxID=3891 RepID=A0AAN9RLW3_PSOTE